MQAEPAALPQLPGKLYENSATREMDDLLAHCISGGWGILYGPSGAQKSFLLEYRAAEEQVLQDGSANPEPAIVLVEVEAAMSPRTLLGRIAMGLGSAYAQSSEGIRQGIFAAI